MVDYENPWTFEEPLFYLRILTITSVLSISLQISKTVANTSEENTSGQIEKPRGKSRRVKSESDWKKYYGSSDELNADRKEIGNEYFRREILSLHKTKGQVNYEETKQLFLNNVLTEALDDGGPLYYNSNILGRYMKKNYGNFGRNTCLTHDWSIDRIHKLSESYVNLKSYENGSHQRMISVGL